MRLCQRTTLFARFHAISYYLVPRCLRRRAKNYAHGPGPRETAVEDLARILARELAGQEVTPALVQSLGILPGASIERIRGACQHARALGLASRCDPDGTVALLPRDEQPNAPKGLLD